MPERTSPPFRADHIGSLLRPRRLRDARDALKRGEITSAELRAVEDAEIRDIVRFQQDLGYHVVTDGEFRRNWFHIDFLEKLANVAVVPSSIPLRFHNDGGDVNIVAPGLRVGGRLARPEPICLDAFSFLQSASSAVAKVTIPSPSTLHFRGGRNGIDRAAYPEMSDFYADLARVYSEEIMALGAAGCRYVQIDEVNIAFLCDPTLRERVKSIGEDPERLLPTYIDLLNRSIAGRPADMKIGIHLCRGNFKGAWLAEGGYDPVAEILFNELDADGFLLEYDTPRAGSFAPLRFVPADKMVVLGLVTTKDARLESKDELARRIDEAARYLPLDQLGLSPQCGFSSHIDASVVTPDDQRAKLGRVVEVARDVWG
jgi:5-methyltetrahydropteroyltriglutamate--homocysteine methyltransferase